MLYDDLQEKRDLILRSANKNGIQKIRVFGSAARREDDPSSDLDLLVTFEGGRSLFDLIRFKNEMEELLNVKVDVVTEHSIHRNMKDRVKNEAIEL
ncbi:hypothetical protein EDD68_1225 [Melghiribacillus thermohalophilus]|uniref:Polymerase nucleotidyl transferase domain-containing protein n=1 Tax=Melghiribacillus thermohalophilus TaxID=1324956 RepID=A0A4R3MQQ5_9BACI|nr:nucleotidyltransferase family protein [Melghiribacillus thermohalophilus]TCT18243.1 hypothetical protein EDD68_1225 [Melghiribacillus thermohalophilus]